MNKLILSYLILLAGMTACSKPQSKELQSDQENFSINVHLAKSCNEGTYGSSNEMYFRCENLYALLNFLLNEEYNMNHLKTTGLPSGRVFGSIDFLESGMRHPYDYNIDITFKDTRENRKNSIPEVIRLIEQEYQLQINYTEKKTSIYELQIVDEEAYEAATKNARALKKQKPTINLSSLDRMKSNISFHYDMHVKTDHLAKDNRTIALYFTEEFDDFQKQLKNVGLALVSKDFTIPYPNIQYL